MRPPENDEPRRAKAGLRTEKTASALIVRLRRSNSQLARDPAVDPCYEGWLEFNDAAPSPETFVRLHEVFADGLIRDTIRRCGEAGVLRQADFIRYLAARAQSELSKVEDAAGNSHSHLTRELTQAIGGERC